MKIDPIYLLAPKRVPSMPTRRAFLIAGGTFVLGTSLGGACGYAMGVEAVDASGKAGEGGVAPVPAPAGEEELKPSGDVELDELRRLAVKAPIAELLERQFMFVNAVSKVYQRDVVLWRGVDRLADALIVTVNVKDRRVSARFLAQVIEKADSQFSQPLAKKVLELRAIK